MLKCKAHLTTMHVSYYVCLSDESQSFSRDYITTEFKYQQCFNLLTC